MLWQTSKGLYFLEVGSRQPNTISLLYIRHDPCPFRAQKDTLLLNSWQNTHRSSYFVEEVLVILHLCVLITMAKLTHFRPERSLAVYKRCFVPIPDEALLRGYNTKKPQKDFSEISTWAAEVHKSWQPDHNSDKSIQRRAMPFPIQSDHGSSTNTS